MMSRSEYAKTMESIKRIAEQIEAKLEFVRRFEIDAREALRYLRENCRIDIAEHSLIAERDAYRAQATAFAEALVELGRQDLVDAAIAAAGERQ